MSSGISVRAPSHEIDQCFVNRDQALTDLMERVESLQHDSPLQMLVYFGVGGIGKSRLLREMEGRVLKYREHCTPEKLDILRCDLGLSEHVRVSDVLFHIRRQCDFPTPLFDHALARVWAHERKTVQIIRDKGAPDDGLVYDVIESAAAAAELFAPVKLFKNLIGKSAHHLEKHYGAYSEEIEKIERTSVEVLNELLPVYLGRAIAALRGQNHRLVVFLDGLDEGARMGVRRDKKCLRANSKWLRDFIATCDWGLFVACSRNRLNWARDERAWEPVLVQQLLGRLHRRDALDLLTRRGLKDDLLKLTIVQMAKGNPLFLHLCASLALDAPNQINRLSQEDASEARARVIDRYLDNLDEHYLEAIKACCVLRRFDDNIFETICEALHIHVPVTKFDDFCESSYAEKASASPTSALHPAYRIQSMIREHVFSTLPYRTIERVLAACVKYGQQLRSTRQFSQLLWLVQDMLDVLARSREPTAPDLAGDIVELAVSLAANGFAAEISDSAHIPKTVQAAFPWLAAATTLLRSICAHRQGDLKKASGWLGKSRPSLVGDKLSDRAFYMDALLLHKTGKYTQAGAAYETLSKRHEPRKHNSFYWQAGYLAKRKLADLSILKGEFKTARDLLDMLDDVGQGDALWTAEVRRLQGHLFRFNFDSDKAAAMYQDALSIATDGGLPFTQAKAMTNLAETLCWSAPSSALQHAQAAITLHSQRGQRIETGKALAAMAIAYFRLGRFREAHTSACKSEALQQQTGYAAGCLFAQVPKALALLGMKQSKRTRAIRDQLRQEASKLGVYRFLEMPVTIALREPLPTDILKMKWLNGSPPVQLIEANVLS